MRQLLLVLVALSAFSRAWAADNPVTNAVPLGKPGTLEMVTPRGWTLQRTNLNLPDSPVTMELHSPGNTTAIRLTIYWDGFKGGTIVQPGNTKRDIIVSNNAVQYVDMSIEKKIVVEQLKGPAMTGSFARFTDATWTPVVKNEYRTLTTGMFSTENIWGTFDLLTGDKDGPMFKQAIEVIKSFRRKP
ncbi:MAG TPA: hypothetical protein VN761_10185 [Candidatus Polarisedimenticolia bacterium]|nr:hypothetical protein [Candidatus Polarisedimenticolia bacterium]